MPRIQTIYAQNVLTTVMHAHGAVQIPELNVVDQIQATHVYKRKMENHGEEKAMEPVLLVQTTVKNVISRRHQHPLPFVMLLIVPKVMLSKMQQETVSPVLLVVIIVKNEHLQQLVSNVVRNMLPNMHPQM